MVGVATGVLVGSGVGGGVDVETGVGVASGVGSKGMVVGGVDPAQATSDTEIPKDNKTRVDLAVTRRPIYASPCSMQYVVLARRR